MKSVKLARGLAIALFLLGTVMTGCMEAENESTAAPGVEELGTVGEAGVESTKKFG